MAHSYSPNLLTLAIGPMITEPIEDAACSPQSMSPPVAKTPSDPAECYRAAELAPLLGIPRLRLYELVRQRHIPHKRLGRTILFPKQRIHAWLTEAPSTHPTH
jgi:excisionase family DNA binding protein